MNNNDRQIVELIERANDAQPICPCGRHTTPIWRDGAVWLECSSRIEPRDSYLQKVMAVLTALSHTRTRIVDVPFAADTAA